MDHTHLNEARDRLHRELDILDRMDEAEWSDPPSLTRITLLLQQMKRVRAASNLCVRALARTRDQLQSQEDTSA